MDKVTMRPTGFVSHKFMMLVFLLLAIAVAPLLYKVAAFAFRENFSVVAPYLCIGGMSITIVLTHAQVRVLGFSSGVIVGLPLTLVFTYLLWPLESKMLVTLAMGIQVVVATLMGNFWSRQLREYVLPRYAGKLEPIFLDQSLNAIPAFVIWVVSGFCIVCVVSILTIVLMLLLPIHVALTHWVAWSIAFATIAAIPAKLSKGQFSTRLQQSLMKTAIGSVAFLIAVICVITADRSAIGGDDYWFFSLFIPVFTGTLAQLLTGIAEYRKRRAKILTTYLTDVTHPNAENSLLP